MSLRFTVQGYPEQECLQFTLAATVTPCMDGPRFAVASDISYLALHEKSLSNIQYGRHIRISVVDAEKIVA